MGLCMIASAEAEWDEGVLVLTDSNFDEELAKYEHLLVEFYAPWCGHCKKLAPEYVKAAETLKAMDPPRYIAKVDATENKALGDRFGIKGFPTLHFFVNGNKQDYTGGRTAETIVSWISKKTGPPSTEVACDDIDGLDLKLGLVYFGCQECEKFKAFQTVAGGPIGDKFRFIHTSKDCAAKYGASEQGVALIRNFDESPVAHTGEMTVEAIEAFAKANSVPTLITFSDDFVEPIFQDRKAALFLFQEDASASYNSVFADAASQLKGEVLFVTSGVSEGIQQRLGDFIGVTKADLPCVRILDPSKDMAKYMGEFDISSMTVDTLAKFLSDWKSGNLEQFLKSEPIPETQEGPVTVVVGKSYESVVNDPTKDVLVKFYAPWCGHCKKLAPVWDELAEKTKDISDLVIAKFDATANEAPGVEIRGYPTLKFYPKDNKKGVAYDGDRELDDFLKWLGDNSSAMKAHNAGAAHSEEL